MIRWASPTSEKNQTRFMNSLADFKPANREWNRLGGQLPWCCAVKDVTSGVKWEISQVFAVFFFYLHTLYQIVRANSLASLLSILFHKPTFVLLSLFMKMGVSAFCVVRILFYSFIHGFVYDYCGIASKHRRQKHCPSETTA